MFVSKKFSLDWQEIKLVGCLKDPRDEIHHAQIISPARFVLQIDVSERRCYQYGAQIPPRNLFFKPEAFGRRDYGVRRAVEDENWNAKVRDFAVRREGSQFGCIGLDSSEKLRTEQVDLTGHEGIENFSS